MADCRLTLYTKPGCHLCDEMKALVARVSRSIPITLEEIDISTDAHLQKLYGLEIPVLMLGEKKIAKARTTEDALVRTLCSTGTGETGGTGK